MATRKQLVEAAAEKLQEVIKMLEIACKGDANAKAYMVDQLKVLHSRDR